MAFYSESCLVFYLKFTGIEIGIGIGIINMWNRNQVFFNRLESESESESKVLLELESEPESRLSRNCPSLIVMYCCVHASDTLDALSGNGPGKVKCDVHHE